MKPYLTLGKVIFLLLIVVSIHGDHYSCSTVKQSVDYEATMATKLLIAKKIFSLEKEAILGSSSFLKFFSENKVNICSLLRSHLIFSSF